MNERPSILDTTVDIPRTAEGQALDHNCLHCWLALPVQTFMDRNPKATAEQLIGQAAELVAELVAHAAGSNERQLERWRRYAQSALQDWVTNKAAAHGRLHAHYRGMA